MFNYLNISLKISSQAGHNRWLPVVSSCKKNKTRVFPSHWRQVLAHRGPRDKGQSWYSPTPYGKESDLLLCPECSYKDRISRSNGPHTPLSWSTPRPSLNIKVLRIFHILSVASDSCVLYRSPPPQLSPQTKRQHQSLKNKANTDAKKLQFL